MSSMKEIILEAVDPVSKVVRTVKRKLKSFETKAIANSNEDRKSIEFIMDYYSEAFDLLDDEQRQEAIDRVVNYCKALYGNDKQEDNTPLNKEDLKQKIEKFVKEKGGVFYPLADTVEELTNYIMQDPKLLTDNNPNDEDI